MTLHHQTKIPAPDGSPMFLRPSDSEREDAVARRLEAVMPLRLWHLPGLSFVDYLAVWQLQPVGWVEVITRSRTHDELMELGGVALKRATYDTLLALADVPLSTRWYGCAVAWNLADGLYLARVERGWPEGVLSDPRGAANDLHEPVVFARQLRLVYP